MINESQFDTLFNLMSLKQREQLRRYMVDMVMQNFDDNKLNGGLNYVI
jgi:hypothetical protein